MYIENAKVHASLFRNEDDKKKDTDKSIYGTLSVSIKVGEIQGKPVYENDNYKAYFVGGAYEPAKSLESKQRIKINKMTIRNRYVKEKGKNYVSITIYDFEKLESKNDEEKQS